MYTSMVIMSTELVSSIVTTKIIVGTYCRYFPITLMIMFTLGYNPEQRIVI